MEVKGNERSRGATAAAFSSLPKASSRELAALPSLPVAIPVPPSHMVSETSQIIQEDSESAGLLTPELSPAHSYSSSADQMISESEPPLVSPSLLVVSLTLRLWNS